VSGAVETARRRPRLGWAVAPRRGVDGPARHSRLTSVGEQVRPNRIMTPLAGEKTVRTLTPERHVHRYCCRVVFSSFDFVPTIFAAPGWFALPVSCHGKTARHQTALPRWSRTWVNTVLSWRPTPA